MTNQTGGDMKQRMADYVRDLQRRITARLEEVDGKAKFRRDAWTKDDNGGDGVSCILSEGNVFDKAAVNVSVVQGPLSPAAAQQMRSRGKAIPEDARFFAAGLSMIVHAYNPHVPTTHMNYRYFEVWSPSGSAETSWWFGGGADLTPNVLYEEDAKHFHQVYLDACNKVDTSFYPIFKKWCDEYFFITHRGECRGIGGIFFDDLDERWKPELADKEKLFTLAQSCGDAFLESYCPIVIKRKDTPYTDSQLRWQQLRRGRYVEFNLVYDRGTKFGLAAPQPRVESILASLPVTARWEYDVQIEAGSEEDKLMQVLKNPREWV